MTYFQIAAYNAENAERLATYGEFYEDGEGIDADEVDTAYRVLNSLNTDVQSCPAVRMHVERIEVIDHSAARLPGVDEAIKALYVNEELES